MQALTRSVRRDGIPSYRSARIARISANIAEFAMPHAQAAPSESPLTFKVAPHLVEDLGLNLYTTLARVLVEFVANAYDADSWHVDLRFDTAKIKKAREV